MSTERHHEKSVVIESRSGGSHTVIWLQPDSFWMGVLHPVGDYWGEFRTRKCQRTRAMFPAPRRHELFEFLTSITRMPIGVRHRLLTLLAPHIVAGRQGTVENLQLLKLVPSYIQRALAPVDGTLSVQRWKTIEFAYWRQWSRTENEASDISSSVVYTFSGMPISRTMSSVIT